MKRVLFITKAIPASEHSGAFLYANNVIKLIGKIARITIIGFDDDITGKPGGRKSDNIIAVEKGGKSKAWSLFSIYPNEIYQCRSKEFRRSIKKIAGQESYDVIICDHLRMAWAIEYFDRKPLKIMIAQNHEYLSRKSIYEGETSFLKKYVFFLDMIKTKFHEKKLLDKYDKIITLTEEDSSSLGEISSKPMYVVKPGYSGDIVKPGASPIKKKRQIVMLGSYYYSAKQNNLSQFLECTCESLKQAGIKIKIVGPIPDNLRKKLLGKYEEIIITGEVDSFYDHLVESRLAVIAEKSGGGFKLKSLDYIFHGLPVLALRGSMNGFSLAPGEDYLECDKMENLGASIIRSIDDEDLLFNLSQNAFSKCESSFSWESRIPLLEAILSN